ncbi:hypothetical protein PHLGIDRAFT_480306 [Phlebiopsis gigantea 11061_1 CR5-6]|uniref:Uncharacterized protein n=1 Tax=Phlebiopsis gigantea (strain 11061_1 CR5-6) TaxID=745531 RepID=A0A0C3S645_PHLG1|nr:hypothetical protein PHLGIDRAFT_480306 [Phlebiopsis gigantea 11061_1 CR5-6]
MPGDTSSEEGSRANSRQGTDPSVADARSPAAPWATYGPEDGFQNPWPPLKPRRGLGIRTTSGESRPTIAEDNKAPDPAAAQQIQEGWAASIRSSINSALSAMVGQLDPPAEDTLTRLSEQRATAHEFEETSHETGVQSSNTSVLSNPFGDPSVDLDVTSPCNHPEDDAHHDPNCLCEWLKQKQGPAVHLSTLRAPSPDVTHDCPSPRSTYGASPGKAASTPSLTLPAIPVSRAASISSLHQAIKRKHPQRGRSKKFASRAMTALDRMHSASGSSASFPMSRESSTASTTSGPLSDQEQFASTALRERRKRVMDAQRLAARQSLKRPSVRLGSRRQNNGSRVLGVASALRGRMSS